MHAVSGGSVRRFWEKITTSANPESNRNL